MKAFLHIVTAAALVIILLPNVGAAQAPPGPGCDGSHWMDPQWHDGDHGTRVAQFLAHQQQERQQFDQFEAQRFAREQAEQAERERIAQQQREAAERAALCNQAKQNVQNSQAAVAQATIIANNNGCGHNDACHQQLWAAVAAKMAAFNVAVADQTAKCQ